MKVKAVFNLFLEANIVCVVNYKHQTYMYKTVPGVSSTLSALTEVQIVKSDYNSCQAWYGCRKTKMSY